MGPLLIGIAGGTGSGKTTLAQYIINNYGEHLVSLMDTDSYYRDRSHLPLHERHHMNFDNPDALDIPLLFGHLKKLSEGTAIQKQVYDFATHTRRRETVCIEPKKIIVVEGILIFAVEEICTLFDLKIFLDEEADIRLLRRITRDVQERGRTVESVARQYLETVRPMHLQYVESSLYKADIILKAGDDWKRVITEINQLMALYLPS
jgi:uridine kinase